MSAVYIVFIVNIQEISNTLLNVCILLINAKVFTTDYNVVANVRTCKCLLLYSICQQLCSTKFSYKVIFYIIATVFSYQISVQQKNHKYILYIPFVFFFF